MAVTCGLFLPCRGWVMHQAAFAFNSVLRHVTWQPNLVVHMPSSAVMEGMTSQRTCRVCSKHSTACMMAQAAYSGAQKLVEGHKLQS